MTAPVAMAAASVADARPVPYWLDQPEAPDPAAALAGELSADLAVIGGGFTGLWAALLAAEREPSADIVLLEAKTAGWAATGRNGGFCSASLTHGLANGISRFPAEIARLEQLGRQNLDQIEAALSRYGIDCDFQRTGELAVATAGWQLDVLREDNRAIVRAASQASKAADYLLGFVSETAPSLAKEAIMPDHEAA